MSAKEQLGVTTGVDKHISTVSSAPPGRSDSPLLPVGVGCTVLERALASGGHLDGIGTYTQALLTEYARSHAHIRPMAFPVDGTLHPDGSQPAMFKHRFALSAMVSASTGLPFAGARDLAKQIGLFHATDHLIPRLAGTPVLANIMDPIPLMQSDWIKSGFHRTKSWLFRRSVTWADHYLTISSFVAQDLAERLNVDSGRITSIHLGVDGRYFDRIDEAEKAAVLKRLNLRPGFFLFVGTLQPRKNVGALIDAFEQLPLDLRRAHPLVVVGRQGWNAEQEIIRLKRLEADGTGRWLNYVEDLEKRALMQSALAFVFPSLYEGFGLPVLEAFASSLPVIASGTTSIPEVAGDAATLVDPEDREALAFAMQTIAEDRESAAEFAARGLLRARQFTWAETARLTAALYQKLSV
jgi:alpha-1,3-rhamnosyl/mannosyltransferase